MNLARLQTYYNEQRTLLDTAIANHDQQSITVYRGRLIRTLNRLLSPKYFSMLSPAEKRFYNTELTTELDNHRAQLNYRLSSEKRNHQRFSISNEVGLKIRRTSNSVNRIFNARTFGERANAVVSTAGNSLSTLFSISKFAIRPAGFVVQRVGGGVAYLTGYAVGIPVNIMTNLFGSLINPDRTWNFKLARSFGGTFKDVTEDAIGIVNESIIRL